MIQRLFCLLVLLAATTATALAGSGEQQLRQFLDGLTTLRADFQQTLQQADDVGVYRSSGTFYLKRPGQFRWEYDPPNRQLIVADGSRIWLYDKELEQVSHRSQGAALEGTPAQLLSDNAPLDRHFEVKEEGQKGGLTWVELLPKDKESQFSSVRLAMEQGQLRNMEMLDNFGQLTSFEFSHLQRNPELDPELFDFEPPPLVDLIGDL